MNLQMIRAERLVNSRQRGMLTADFVAALSDADRKAAFVEWLRRRSGWAWLAAEDSALLLAMMSDADLLPPIAPHTVGIEHGERIEHLLAHVQRQDGGEHEVHHVDHLLPR